MWWWPNTGEGETVKDDSICRAGISERTAEPHAKQGNTEGNMVHSILDILNLMCHLGGENKEAGNIKYALFIK